MKQKRISFRIQIEPEKVQFIEDYKAENGLSVQKFVIESIDEKIASIQASKSNNVKYYKAGIDPFYIKIK